MNKTTLTETRITNLFQFVRFLHDAGLERDVAVRLRELGLDHLFISLDAIQAAQQLIAEKLRGPDGELPPEVARIVRSAHKRSAAAVSDQADESAVLTK